MEPAKCSPCGWLPITCVSSAATVIISTSWGTRGSSNCPRSQDQDLNPGNLAPEIPPVGRKEGSFPSQSTCWGGWEGQAHLPPVHDVLQPPEQEDALALRPRNLGRVDKESRSHLGVLGPPVPGAHLPHFSMPPLLCHRGQTSGGDSLT